MKIYLDACCLGRLTDDQSQPRIREEAEALERILGLIRGGKVELISSEALLHEIRRNPSAERRLECEALISLATATVEMDRHVLDRAKELEAAGYGAYDAFHVASAESAGADALLSTDDRLLKRAARGVGNPRVAVRNPVSWVRDHRL